MKTKIEAHGCKFMMCSALCQDGLNNVFTESIRQVFHKRFTNIPKKKE
jgi:hypothetical protein